MRKTVIVSALVALSFSTASADSNDNAIGPGPRQPLDNALATNLLNRGACMYADRFYSQGSVICVGYDLPLTCGEKGQWAPGASNHSSVCAYLRRSSANP